MIYTISPYANTALDCSPQITVRVSSSGADGTFNGDTANNGGGPIYGYTSTSMPAPEPSPARRKPFWHGLCDRRHQRSAGSQPGHCTTPRNKPSRGLTNCCANWRKI